MLRVTLYMSILSGVSVTNAVEESKEIVYLQFFQDSSLTPRMTFLCIFFNYLVLQRRLGRYAAGADFAICATR